ncbi:hypothetical protein [Cumulibacter soli]|uniref:hypothetical protein n=1 Tax=Cumulibacter soli TaxID=2546344 RepID=UPI001068D24B|nr:hypothetical protein [Cumulibacter soli]
MPNDPRYEPTSGSGQPALPTVWPSAWPSLRAQVALGATFPVVAAVAGFIILLRTQTLATSWWIAVLPLLLLAWPLSLPARARAAMRRAHEGSRIEVLATQHGLVARPIERRGLKVRAFLEQDGRVRYEIAPRGGAR